MNFTLPVIAFLLTLILVPVLIPTLKKLKFGQSIREEGPKSHMKKTGTPTMGGLTFLLATIVVTIIALFYVEQVGPLILLLFVTLGFGLIGFIDDYIIVVKKNNQGLTSKQKFLAQIAIAVVFYIVSVILPNYEFETAINIPFTDWSLPLSVFYIIFIVFWQVGFSNAVNLTDGLDGLSTGLSIIAFGFYATLSFILDKPEIGLFCLVMLASLFGFLIYNKYPAKVFMGDTGSLALGGIFATISIMLNQEITLLLIGLVFVIETLSVMLQVTSFKLTGKRIFKMSPLHHHFELVGWSEWKIVLVFWATGIVTGAIGLWIGVM
ncbi:MULTISPECIES: phospho-N-acetylmuramoyl-pentapeptide-transferase [Mammaliicoccus]|jgi:phospho-N-acetylmuramoyl-pentapeptide-transferase|uniref:Phospho-N-acetylmuramoyl-pentapeptide-transferase n=1 Tax=Mammaliicoccus sciuri TaxID=1296 RepID=A0AAW5LJD9_MAMSC|nr:MULTISPECIES: phospho-N-acetylmuramoyl-pentapeptide-transferase [Mammaliicoccus]KTT79777.1 phospho-N-acetylmuramoyl-pentapeptide-transferase [Mammaliicoccus sciuri]MBA1396181.1 phospho-N-acetylmuramoyl-pentapeptide-transferase [Mammaliicoccus sciuri]MBF0718245.1 phospho-N-acetylmuramoyl-pentapeptide-transferase [Mammaliicoccus sciuri]MBF0773210.1 phospho-N-acetylmuramoyl-pentapeptide-transferase [Mammaliicoccus sciuri]MBG9205475.1 phospho-N-acetylmuramoyl-pentapeptide-transferase [Mammaliic